jgi:hypothetical protein
VAPVSKALACGDIGVGGLAAITDVADAIDQMLSRARS